MRGLVHPILVYSSVGEQFWWIRSLVQMRWRVLSFHHPSLDILCYAFVLGVFNIILFKNKTQSKLTRRRFQTVFIILVNLFCSPSKFYPVKRGSLGHLSSVLNVLFYLLNNLTKIIVRTFWRKMMTLHLRRLSLISTKPWSWFSYFTIFMVTK